MLRIKKKNSRFLRAFADFLLIVIWLILWIFVIIAMYKIIMEW